MKEETQHELGYEHQQHIDADVARIRERTRQERAQRVKRIAVLALIGATIPAGLYFSGITGRDKKPVKPTSPSPTPTPTTRPQEATEIPPSPTLTLTSTPSPTTRHDMTPTLTATETPSPTATETKTPLPTSTPETIRRNFSPESFAAGVPITTTEGSYFDPLEAQSSTTPFKLGDEEMVAVLDSNIKYLVFYGEDRKAKFDITFRDGIYIRVTTGPDQEMGPDTESLLLIRIDEDANQIEALGQDGTVPHTRIMPEHTFTTPTTPGINPKFSINLDEALTHKEPVLSQAGANNIAFYYKPGVFKDKDTNGLLDVLFLCIQDEGGELTPIHAFTFPPFAHDGGTYSLHEVTIRPNGQDLETKIGTNGFSTSITSLDTSRDQSISQLRNSPRYQRTRAERRVEET